MFVHEFLKFTIIRGKNKGKKEGRKSVEEEEDSIIFDSGTQIKKKVLLFSQWVDLK